MTVEKICDVPFLAPLNDACVALVRDPTSGRPALFASFYSADAKGPPALARVDVETHRSACFRQPEGRGAWQLNQLTDGTLWFGMNGPGQLACFDLRTDTFLPVDRYRPTRPTTHLNAVVEGPDGRLYMPANPSGAVVAHDRAKGAYQEYPVLPDRGDLYDACLTESGAIGVVNGLQHDTYTLDVEDGSVRKTTAPALAGRSNAYSHFFRHDDAFLLLLDNGRDTVEICRYSALDLAFMGSVVLEVPHAGGRDLSRDPNGGLYLSVDGGWLFAVDLAAGTCEVAHRIDGVPSRVPAYYFLDDRHILVTSTTQYYGIYDVESDKLDLRRFAADNPPVDVFSVLEHSSGDVFCSPALGLGLTRVEPEAGQTEVLGLAHDGSGEIYGSAEAEDGKVYSVSYTHAVLTVYDPDQPWQPGRSADANPRNLGPLGNGQYRPVTGIVPGRGGVLCVGTMPEYGARGGALTIVDPRNDTWRVFRHLVPDHSVLGLAAGPNHVYVGTSVIADGFIPPAEGDASLVIFDPDCETVIHSRRIAGARSVVCMGCGAKRLFFWTDDHDGTQRLFCYDMDGDELRRIDGTHRIGRVLSRPMVRTAGDTLCFAHARGITQLDPSSCSTREIWASTKDVAPYLAGSRRGVFFSRGHELWRAVLPACPLRHSGGHPD